MREKHLYRFGEFTLCAEENTLTRNGANVAITPKMFSLLLVLVQNPGKILGKEFLLEQVWPDSFVEEGNITFNIRQLRKALEDDAQSPTFIETIPRRGYRFVAPVEADISGPDSDVDEIDAAAPLVDQTTGSHRYIFLGIAAFVILAGVIAIGGWYLGGTKSSSAPILSAPFTSEKLSTDGGVFHATLTPDGKSIVYTHRSSGKQAIWVRQLESKNNVQIVPPTDEFYGGLTVSPDSGTVYFVRGSQQAPMLSIYRMPISGGVPQRIIDGSQGWISVSGDGKRVSFIRCPYSDEDYCSLYVADSADGQNEKRLVTRPRPFRIGDNKISPDGKTVAFAVGQSRTSSNEFQLMGVDIETGVERELATDRFFNINYIAWLPDQSGALFTGMQFPDSYYRIWKAGPSGETSKLTTDSETYSRMSLDATGSMLVTTTVEPDFRLMIYQTDNPTIPPRELLNAANVAFAPDGKLFFATQRTGDSEIWSVNADGSDQRQLTNDPGGDVAPMISPDNRTVFFESNRSGKIHVWQMNPDGTNQKQVTFEDGGYPLRISADGQWLYYRSGLNNNLRRVEVATGKEELVLREVGRNLVVSPDLTRVAYSERRNSETTITVLSLADQSVVKTYRVVSAPNLAHLSWSNDGEYLAYVLTDDAREIGSLWFQRLSEETPKQIVDLSGETIAELFAFSLAPDGKTFAVIRGNWKHDAVLIRGLK